MYCMYVMICMRYKLVMEIVIRNAIHVDHRREDTITSYVDGTNLSRHCMLPVMGSAALNN